MSPLQSAISAAIAQIVSVVVSFGVINNTLAGGIISASTAVIAVAFIVASELRHDTDTRAAIAREQAKTAPVKKAAK